MDNYGYGVNITDRDWVSISTSRLSGLFDNRFSRTRIGSLEFEGLIVPVGEKAKGVPRRFIAALTKVASNRPGVVPVVGNVEMRDSKGRRMMRIGFVPSGVRIVSPLVALADSFGQSTHSSYATGIGQSDVDHLIVHPHTGWMGNRGVRRTFGAEEDDAYGRLYRSPPFHELVQASPGDRGALQSRSGQSGYRGGRPTFGAHTKRDQPQVYGADQARIDIGPLRYEGSPFGAVALGLGALVLFFKGPMGV